MSPTKTVYAFSDSGHYIGPTLAQESPLEPGVWLFPENCTEVPPPELEPSQRAKFEAGQWVIESDAPAPPVDPWAAIRATRDALLKDSDWTMLPDAPVSDSRKESVRQYRSALRDIPQKFSDPLTVVWPPHP